MKNNTKRLVGILLCLAMVLAVLPMAVSAWSEETITLYYDNTETGWDSVNAHYWIEGGETTEWPGVAMTQVDDTVWSIEVPVDATMIIFNNGNGAQTGNLEIPGDGYCHNYYQWVVYGESFDEIEVAYYVAGSAELCGEAWNPSAEANKMTDNGDGSYEITYTDVVAGTYEFKVTDGTWNNSWGAADSADNYVLTLEADADVTIVFDSVNKLVSVEIDAAATEDPTETPEDPTEAPEDPTEAPEDPTEAPEDPTEAPEDPTEAPEDPTEAPVVDETPDTAIVTAVVPADWTNPCIWAWNGNDNAFESWPGEPMTKDGDVFTAVVPSWVTGVIINDGAAEGAKTADLTVVAGKDVTITVTVSDSGVNADIAYTDGSAPVEPETPVITGEFRVVGSEDWMGSWDPASDAGLMTEVSAGVYEVTFKDVPVGNYAFKITKDGTWDENWGKDGFNTDNIALNVTVAGDVTVVFKAANAAISYKTAAMDEFIPVTGDMSIAAVCAALLVATAGLVCTVSKKKEF